MYVQHMAALGEYMPIGTHQAPGPEVVLDWGWGFLIGSKRADGSASPPPLDETMVLRCRWT